MSQKSHRIGRLSTLAGYHLRRASGAFAVDFREAVGGMGMRQVLVGVLAVVEANPGVKQPWDKGDKIPGREQLNELARVFGVPAGALLGELASTLDPARTKGENDLLAAYRRLGTKQQGALLEVARSMQPKAQKASR